MLPGNLYLVCSTTAVVGTAYLQHLAAGSKKEQHKNTGCKQAGNVLVYVTTRVWSCVGTRTEPTTLPMYRSLAHVCVVEI